MKIIKGKSFKIEYQLNDKHHRKDGPAIERADGYKEWYINGKLVTESTIDSKNNSK